MSIVVTTDARPLRRAVGVTAWAVLEELVLDADVDSRGSGVARSNVRKLAAELGVSKDTVARALNRLARAGIVSRVVADRGAHGALPTSSYLLDLTRVVGVDIDAHDAARLTAATDINPDHRATRRRASRPAAHDDAQTSLFDLSASVS